MPALKSSYANLWKRFCDSVIFVVCLYIPTLLFRLMYLVMNGLILLTVISEHNGFSFLLFLKQFNFCGIVCSICKNAPNSGLFLSWCCFSFQRCWELVSLPSHDAIWAIKVHSQSQPCGPCLTQPASPTQTSPTPLSETTAPLVYHSRPNVVDQPCGTCWDWRATSCASVTVTFLLHFLQNPTAVYYSPVLQTVGPPLRPLFSILKILPVFSLFSIEIVTQISDICTN